MKRMRTQYAVSALAAPRADYSMERLFVQAQTARIFPLPEIYPLCNRNYMAQGYCFFGRVVLAGRLCANGAHSFGLSAGKQGLCGAAPKSPIWPSGRACETRGFATSLLHPAVPWLRPWNLSRWLRPLDSRQGDAVLLEAPAKGNSSLWNPILGE